MRIRKFIVMAAIASAPIGFAANVSASVEGVVNKGACVKGTEFKQVVATSNGPLTISANDVLHTAQGHIGGVGCSVK